MEKYRISSLDGELASPVYTKKFCIKPEDILDEMEDELWQIIDDVRYDYTPEPIGVFSSENEAEELVIDIQRKKLLNMGRDIVAVSEKLDNVGKILCSKHIHMNDMLLKMYDDMCNDHDGYLCIGYIEDCLNEFVRLGQWHIDCLDNHGNKAELRSISNLQKAEGCLVSSNGEKYFPVLWFGIDKMTPLWSICCDTTDEQLKFWHSDTIDEFFSAMGDFSDTCFMIWYGPECGCWIPDMEKILTQCPVKICSNDTVKEIMNKTVDYIYANMRCE